MKSAHSSSFRGGGTRCTSDGDGEDDSVLARDDADPARNADGKELFSDPFSLVGVIVRSILPVANIAGRLSPVKVLRCEALLWRGIGVECFLDSLTHAVVLLTNE